MVSLLQLHLQNRKDGQISQRSNFVHLWGGHLGKEKPNGKLKIRKICRKRHHCP
jgi:hypothetical protein